MNTDAHLSLFVHFETPKNPESYRVSLRCHNCLLSKYGITNKQMRSLFGKKLIRSAVEPSMEYADCTEIRLRILTSLTYYDCTNTIIKSGKIIIPKKIVFLPLEYNEDGFAEIRNRGIWSMSFPRAQQH